MNVHTILHSRHGYDGDDRQQDGRQFGTDVEHDTDGDEQLQGVAGQQVDVVGHGCLHHLCVGGQTIGQFTSPRGRREGLWD